MKHFELMLLIVPAFTACALTLAFGSKRDKKAAGVVLGIAAYVAVRYLAIDSIAPAPP